MCIPFFKVEELKPGGSNIPVTSVNRIEYIHLTADYRLNRQIRAQCNAFRQVCLTSHVDLPIHVSVLPTIFSIVTGLGKYYSLGMDSNV